jgi:hypothetical protein
MNEESAPSGPTRLPPLDPEMRSAIARRLLFCRTYRQLKKSLKPRHNQVAERYARLEAGHRLTQASFAQMRRVIRFPADQVGMIGLGHQWKSVPDLS